jgi:hypothetical protein
MPAKTGFSITSDDVAILQFVYECRFARLDHLAALTHRSYFALAHRLQKLIKHHYLARIVLPGHKHIYTIGHQALAILVERGIAPDAVLDTRPRHQELKDFFLKHELFISDIHTALAVSATTSHPIRLVDWRQGQELFDSVTFLQQGKPCRLPVRPDGFFTLADTQRPPKRNKVHFFLEVDRSTATHTRFADKITAYWHYFQNGLHEKKYGIKTFRVVTVTLTPERAANLCDLARSILPAPAHRFYLFSSVDRFSFENPTAILGNIFITPKDTAAQPLIPPQVVQ